MITLIIVMTISSSTTEYYKLYFKDRFDPEVQNDIRQLCEIINSSNFPTCFRKLIYSRYNNELHVTTTTNNTNSLMTSEVIMKLSNIYINPLVDLKDMSNTDNLIPFMDICSLINYLLLQNNFKLFHKFQKGYIITFLDNQMCDILLNCLSKVNYKDNYNELSCDTKFVMLAIGITRELIYLESLKQLTISDIPNLCVEIETINVSIFTDDQLKLIIHGLYDHSLKIKIKQKHVKILLCLSYHLLSLKININDLFKLYSAVDIYDLNNLMSNLIVQSISIITVLYF